MRLWSEACKALRTQNRRMVTFVVGAVLRWALGSVVLLMAAWATAGFCGSSENS